MYRANVNGKEITVFISPDGSVFRHDLLRGQVTLANSAEAYQWLLAHCQYEDLENVVRRLKPELRHQLISSHLV